MSEPEDYYFDDPVERQAPRAPRRTLSKIFSIGFLAFSVTLGLTYASDINLSSSPRVEFGQGIALSTTCDTYLLVTPSSGLANAANGGTFNIETITVSDIASTCAGKSFKINLYDQSNSAPLNSTPLIVSAPAAGITSISFGQIFSSGSTKIASALVFRITIESQDGGGNDGLTAASASTSAYQIKTDFPNSPDGFYWIQNANINSGNPVQIYADMTRNGGGWTLIVMNSANGWNAENTLLSNQLNPPTDLQASNLRYSILQWADLIKKSPSGFQYRLEAQAFGRWGGVFTANQNYSFISQSNQNTSITINQQFSDWDPTDDYSPGGKRMMWYAPNGEGTLVAGAQASGYWWGAFTARSGWNPAPWYSGGGNMNVLWYWVR